MSLLSSLLAPLICAVLGHHKPPPVPTYWGAVHRCGVQWRGFAPCVRCEGHGPFGHVLTVEEVKRIEPPQEEME